MRAGGIGTEGCAARDGRGLTGAEGPAFSGFFFFFSLFFSIFPFFFIFLYFFLFYTFIYLS